MAPQDGRIQDTGSSSNSVLAFFAITVVLTLPLWIMGGLLPRQILPGLPLSSLMVICPVSAAAILRFRESGATGVRDLLRRAVDVRRIQSAVWLLPTMFLKPIAFLLAYGVMRLMAVPMPAPQVDGLAAGLLLIFFVSALGEELGWMGYAYEPLERRWGDLGAALLIGLIWTIWHLIPFLQVERSLSWIAWQSLYLMGSRVLLVWVFKKTGRSVFAAAVFHATGNLSWQLFPVQGSHYDPRVVGMITAAIAIVVVLVSSSRRDTEQGGRSRKPCFFTTTSGDIHDPGR